MLLGGGPKARLFCYLAQELLGSMSNTKPIENEITDLIANDFLAHDELNDYDLVRVKLTSGGRFLTLQVMA
jgi:hypothetical protein